MAMKSLGRYVKFGLEYIGSCALLMLDGEGVGTCPSLMNVNDAYMRNLMAERGDKVGFRDSNQLFFPGF